MSANERRRDILLVLFQRKKETRENLAFEFGVSKRTIENDILELSRDKPVYTKQGNGGGIYIDEDFVPDMKFFTDIQMEFTLRLLERLEGEDRAIVKSMIETFAPPKWRRRKR